jgi:hypothetical protein
MAAVVPEHTLRDYLASLIVQRTQKLFEAALNPFVKRCMKEAFPLQCVGGCALFFSGSDILLFVRAPVDPKNSMLG